MFLMKKFSVLFCIVVLLSAVFVLSAYAALNSSKTVLSSGRISTVNVGVYKDSACTQTATSIDWGNLTAGSSTNFTLYIKNLGTSRETLSLTTNGWSPSTASQYLTITWDQNNVALNSNQVVKANLTLNVSASIDSSITTFSNNITITGTM
jgi:hypothetical protein